MTFHCSFDHLKLKVIVAYSWKDLEYNIRQKWNIIFMIILIIAFKYELMC